MFEGSVRRGFDINIVTPFRVVPLTVDGVEGPKAADLSNAVHAGGVVV